MPTDASMLPSQMHVTRMLLTPDAQSSIAYLWHSFIRVWIPRPSMQQRRFCVCSPQCLSSRCFNAGPYLMQHSVMCNQALGNRSCSSLLISQRFMCANSFLIPLRVLVRGLTRTHSCHRDIFHWCRSSPFVEKGRMLYLAGWRLVRCRATHATAERSG